MFEEKCTPALRQTAICAAPEDTLSVVLEVKEPQTAAVPSTGSRAEKIQSRKAFFASAAQPLRETIERLGGEVLGEAWLNSTMSVKIPKQALEILSKEDSVQSIDTGHVVARE